MMLPAAIIGLTGLVAVKKRKEPVIPPHIQAQRQVIYEAMLNCHDPVKLRRVSAAFLAQGYKPEGLMLELRARLAEAPPEVKRERRETIQKALGSKNPAAMRNVAAAFDAIGATGTAARIRQAAKAVEEASAMGLMPTDQAQAQPEEPKTEEGSAP